MSDLMDSRMEEAEVKRLERLLGLRKKELDGLEKKTDLLRPRNRRYNVDFSFTAQDYALSLVPLYVLQKSVTINKNTRFFCECIEQHYAVTSAGATFNLGPSFMFNFMRYEFQVRDTGSDREWSNTWLPSEYLFSGDRNGLEMNHAMLSGGAEIEVSVRVMLLSSGNGAGTLLQVIEKHLLQISFVGVEVPEDFDVGDAGVAA